MLLPDAMGDPRRERTDERVTVDDFRLLQRLMQREAGIVLEAGKEYLVEARLSALALREGFSTVRALIDALQTEDDHGSLQRSVVESLAISETSFFRDMSPFEVIRRDILPALIQRRGAERTLKIWSAACSSGQEPYSVAMLLRENFAHLYDWNVWLLASDMSRGAIRRASSGAYSQVEVNRGLPAALLVRYFKREGAEWYVREELQRMVQFRELNLAAPWPPLPAMDLILMRNVLLYLDQATRTMVLDNVARTLSPDGFLILGGGETTLTVGEAFVPVKFGRTIGYQCNPAVARPRRYAA